MEKFNRLASKVSEEVTRSYSTSFYTAARLFDSDIRDGIFSIYGFVRLADEIVDSFHDYDKTYLLDKFTSDYYESLESGISLNPVLQSFQKTVKKYKISGEHVNSFLASMRRDLTQNVYSDKDEANEYIYGSADVVGLMCLKVFCNGNESLYQELEKPAMKLGSAFQKVNFLRDLKDDTETLGRNYFYHFGVCFNDEVKKQIINDIRSDFSMALIGLKKLPGNSRLAVYVAYSYYMALLRKIEKATASEIANKRVRISNASKLFILVRTIIQMKLRIRR